MAFGCTARLYRLLALGFLLLPLVALNGRLLALLAAYDILLLLAAGLDLLTLPAGTHLTARRSCVRVAFHGRSVRVEIDVTNRGRARLSVDVADSPPALLEGKQALVRVRVDAGSSARGSYGALAAVRGEGAFGDLALRWRRPGGLAWRQREAPANQPLSVLPDLRDLVRDTPGREAAREGERRVRAAGAGSEFEQMRPYAAGDDPRKVDWKATARSRHLMVRQYRADRNREVVFLLETGRAMAIPWGVENRFDAALTAVLTVTRRALDSGDRVRVFAVGEDVRALPAAKLRRDFPVLVRRLNPLAPTDVEPHRLSLYARLAQILPHKALVILFTDLALIPQDRLWFSTLRILRTRHRVLLVHMSDPALRQERRRIPSTLEAAAEVTVAGWFLQRERRAVHILRREGIRVLVARPGRMASDLLRQYEEAREAGWG